MDSLQVIGVNVNDLLRIGISLAVVVGVIMAAITLLLALGERGRSGRW